MHVQISEKVIRFHWQAFIAYKNGENLKMLIDIFCQKLIVYNVILAFLDHLKSKTFFVGQPRDQHRALPLSKMSGSAPEWHQKFQAGLFTVLITGLFTLF